MIKKYTNLFLKPSVALFMFLAGLKVFVSEALAVAPLETKPKFIGGTSQAEAFRKGAGFTATESVGGVIASYISGFLSILGIIFIILIIFAGFRWMNAAGNEEKVEKARDTIIRASIGLAIIIAAYAITYFVFTNLQGIGTGGATGGSGMAL